MEIDDLNTWLETGREKFNNRDYEGAIKDFDEVVKRDSYRCSEAYFYRGKAKFELRDFEGAIKDFSEAYRRDPYGYSEAYIYCGKAKFEFCDFKGAIKEFDYIIAVERLSAYYADAYFFRARVKMELGDDNGAWLDFDKAIEINPKDGRYYFERGKLRYKCNHTALASDDFEEAANLGVAEAEAKLKEHHQEFLPFLR